MRRLVGIPLRAAAVGVALSAVSGAAASQSAGPAPWARTVGNDTTRLRAWRGLEYGSEAYFSPLTVLLNKGYEIFQVKDSPRDIWSFPYGRTWTHATRSVITDANGAVRRFGGWSREARVELLPLSFNQRDGNWVPNYLEHLLGGGVGMRMLDDWFRAHGVPYPRAWAIAASYVSSLMNETIEARGDTVGSSGSVADLLFFDLAAITLFHWDQPTRFLTETLQMADWSNQATFTFPDRKLQNNGQYMTVKIPVGFDRWRVFGRFGLSGQTGVSWKRDDAHHLSVGFGGDTDARFVDATGHETVAFQRGAGIYYDRDNSLLWSATVSGAENLAAINVFPGVLPRPFRELGAWVVLTRHRQLMFGVVHRRALGIGLGYGR